MGLRCRLRRRLAAAVGPFYLPTSAPLPPLPRCTFQPRSGGPLDLRRLGPLGFDLECLAIHKLTRESSPTPTSFLDEPMTRVAWAETDRGEKPVYFSLSASVFLTSVPSPQIVSPRSRKEKKPYCSWRQKINMFWVWLSLKKQSCTYSVSCLNFLRTGFSSSALPPPSPSD